MTNQTPEAVTPHVRDGGQRGGHDRALARGRPDTVATMQVDTEEGDYELRASDGQIEPVAITVGAPRPSGPGPSCSSP